MHIIAVQPVDGGWAVSSDFYRNDMIYRSGADAEVAARQLGERLSEAGEHAEIRIYLRDGSRLARFTCAPAAKPRLLWEAAEQRRERQPEPA
jgi:hypothetical protein